MPILLIILVICTAISRQEYVYDNIYLKNEINVFRLKGGGLILFKS